jgi:5-(carboxyamino)imidazole ribonucleotide synthase
VLVRPGPEALGHAQDKVVMREALEAIGAPLPRHAVVVDVDEVVAFGLPCVLKTSRGGYDGRGVWFVATPEECGPAFEAATAAGVRILAEERVDFRRELSALVARSPSGQAAAYPVVESVQRDGICHEVVAPAPGLPDALATEAQRLALRIARELDVTGILAVELFETTGGAILVNELAMRPHNTGHWTQDGAVTSQFENHLRAVLDLPLGSPAPRAPWTVMVNVLGRTAVDGAALYDRYPIVLAQDAGLRVHLYGKEVRRGRKLGHVNAYGDDLADCLARARRGAEELQPADGAPEGDR